jgi:hypothetical protein
VAWFSSAASVSLQRHRPTPRPSAPEDPSFTEVAATVESRARRLRERLASASAPQAPTRNPFAFKREETPRPRARAIGTTSVPAETLPAVPPEPMLTLIGIAEELKPQGLVRTAMIATETNELIMVGVEGAVTHRYKVTAIGADVIELTDAITGSVRRLALERQ